MRSAAPAALRDFDRVLGVLDLPESCPTARRHCSTSVLGRARRASGQRSDELRDELAELGVSVEDTRDGQRWRLTGAPRWLRANVAGGGQGSDRPQRPRHGRGAAVAQAAPATRLDRSAATRAGASSERPDGDGRPPRKPRRRAQGSRGLARRLGTPGRRANTSGRAAKPSRPPQRPLRSAISSAERLGSTAGSDRGRPGRRARARHRQTQREGLIGEGEELIAGRRPVEEAFAARRARIRLLIVPERRAALDALAIHATTLRIPVIEVEGGTLTALAGFDGHQGSRPGRRATSARRRRTTSWHCARQRDEPPFVLALDSLEDPQNFGTLLRSAEACGVHGVLFPTRRAAPLSPAAIKACRGRH